MPSHPPPASPLQNPQTPLIPTNLETGIHRWAGGPMTTGRATPRSSRSLRTRTCVPLPQSSTPRSMDDSSMDDSSIQRAVHPTFNTTTAVLTETSSQNSPTLIGSRNTQTGDSSQDLWIPNSGQLGYLQFPPSPVIRDANVWLNRLCSRIAKDAASTVLWVRMPTQKPDRYKRDNKDSSSACRRAERFGNGRCCRRLHASESSEQHAFVAPPAR